MEEIRKKNILWIDRVESTNDEMRKIQDPTNGFCIATHFQEKGRGQMGNRWESDYGANLLASYYFEPSLHVENSFLISMAASLSIAQFLESYVSGVNIKWPNDILVNRKKIGGILIENEIQGNQITKTIIGIGINVNQKQFSNLPHATSLYIETATDYEIESLVLELQRFLIVQFSNMTQHSDTLKTDYMARLYNKDKGTYVQNQEPFEASIFDVAYDGKLTLRLKDNTFRHFYFKEVEIPLE